LVFVTNITYSSRQLPFLKQLERKLPVTKAGTSDF
jgi:hypothetical protein